MATTNFGWTTPALGGANNVPADLLSLANQIDASLAPLAADRIKIGGSTYNRSGTWASETLGTPAGSSGVVYWWTLSKTFPYTLPAGWAYAIHVVSSNSFTAAGQGASNTIRVININHASPTIRLGWSIVRVS